MIECGEGDQLRDALTFFFARPQHISRAPEIFLRIFSGFPSGSFHAWTVNRSSITGCYQLRWT